MKTYSITSSGTRALLIDLDNCPRQIEELPEALAGFQRAIACYGGVEPKMHVSVVLLLAAAINEGKLDIIGMQKFFQIEIGRFLADDQAGFLNLETRQRGFNIANGKSDGAQQLEQVAAIFAIGQRRAAAAVIARLHEKNIFIAFDGNAHDGLFALVIVRHGQ